MTRKLTLEEFVKKSTNLHSGLYNYSKFVYVNNTTKSIIICSSHGEFLQSPKKHLIGHGCPHCSNNTKRSNEEFVIAAKAVHGDIYNYSMVNYKNNLSKVVIICKLHGKFLQSPISHINHRCGCPQCSHNVLKTNDDFILQASTTHRDIYDYSKTNYVNDQTKVIIVCKNHGDFLQTPNKHLAGQGCPTCVNKNKTTDIFILQANAIHESKYNYSEFIYRGAFVKGIIICSKHGRFEQTPDNHLHGKGCSKCVGKYSIKCDKWIDSLSNKNIIKGFRMRITGFKRKIEFDGFDPTTNIVYEFYGDRWHGNPQNFPQNKMDTAIKKTYGELYQYAMNREKLIKNAGFQMVTIWEYEWDRRNKT